MSLHVIVGAGPVGTATAKVLAERGDQVRIITRRGGGPEHPNVERVAGDATDADRLSKLTDGADALYNCASPQYHRWFQDWPPLAAALLAAAERTGAVLTVASNLYGYGPVSGPITSDTPLAATHPKLKLRGDMWRDALKLHESGRIRMTEVRGSDYLEANSIFSEAVAAPMLAGTHAYPPIPLDVKHSWTAIGDVARTLATVSGDKRAWGRAWLVPTNIPLTIQELTGRLAAVRGLSKARVTSVPFLVLWTAGLFNPMAKELRHTRYQFARVFTIDSTLTERTFGLAPTPIDEVLATISAQ